MKTVKHLAAMVTKDEEYADDWKNGDPCADRWGRASKLMEAGLGSLMHLANDPEKARFQGNDLASVVAEIKQRRSATGRTSRLTGDEADEGNKDIENPGKRNYEITD